MPVRNKRKISIFRIFASQTELSMPVQGSDNIMQCILQTKKKRKTIKKDALYLKFLDFTIFSEAWKSWTKYNLDLSSPNFSMQAD